MFGVWNFGGGIGGPAGRRGRGVKSFGEASLSAEAAALGQAARRFERLGGGNFSPGFEFLGSWVCADGGVLTRDYVSHRIVRWQAFSDRR